MESRTTTGSLLDSIGLDVGPDGFEISWKPRQRPKSLDAWPLPTQPPDLSHLPGFTAADVQANRQCALAAVQRNGLHRHLRDLLVAGASLVGFCVFGFVMTGFNIVMILWWLGVAVIGYHVLNAVQDLSRTGVASVEGDVWRQFEPDNEGPDRYYLRVNGFKLETEKAVYQRIFSGGPYRIFYVPLSQRVVGGEALPGWRALSQAQRPSGIGRE